MRTSAFYDLKVIRPMLVRFSAAIIFEITYGHRVYSNEDEYFRMSEQFVHLLMDAGQPSLLDIAPFCTSNRFILTLIRTHSTP